MVNPGSILNQLAKYQPKVDVTELDIYKEEKEEQNNLNFSLVETAKELGVPTTWLTRVPNFQYSNILYPHKLLCVYYLVQTGKYWPGRNIEKICDKMLHDFTIAQIGRVGLEGYLLEFNRAHNQMAQRLTALRVLVATFGIGEKKMDRISPIWRNTALKMLKIDHSVGAHSSIDMLEKANKNSSLEDQIIGRIGYLLLWKKLASINSETIMMLPYDG